MSMIEYAVYDYGLLLTRDTMKALAEMHCEDFTEDRFEEDEFAFYEEIEDVFCGNIVYTSEFTGEAKYIEDDGTCGWGCDSVCYDSDYIYYVPIDRRLTLFEAAYKNMDDMIADFKERVGKYMPDDFDYRTNLRYIVGTCFG